MFIIKRVLTANPYPETYSRSCLCANDLLGMLAYKTELISWEFMSSQLAHLIQKTFCGDQNSYIMQHTDGNYHRTYGVLDAARININMSQKKSFGSYQKNLDSTINWICFDFDVSKEHLDKPSFEALTVDLNTAVDDFCDKLTLLKIPFLLEFSGNRGMHVWIIFPNELNIRTAI